MMFVRDGDWLLVIASNMGATRHPDWYGNLVVDPQVLVEVGDESCRADASPMVGVELRAMMGVDQIEPLASPTTRLRSRERSRWSR